MKAQDMIELNNQKRELLTAENEVAYGNMLVYLRLSNVSEQKIEELLLEILDHLLEAQEEGKNAYDVFGNDLREYCDELLFALPNQKAGEKFSLIGFVVTLLLAIDFGLDTIASFFIFAFEKNKEIPSPPFSILGTALSVVIIIIGIHYILHLLKRDSFTGIMNWKQKIELVLSFVLPFILSILVHIYFEKQTYLVYHLSLWQNALLTFVFFISYKILYRTSTF